MNGGTGSGAGPPRSFLRKPNIDPPGTAGAWRHPDLGRPARQRSQAGGIRTEHRCPRGAIAWGPPVRDVPLTPVSPVVDATSPDSRHEAVQAAAAAVRTGGLVVMPTDTVYGIGCDAFDRDAVARLLEAKGRDREMPPPVLVGDVKTLDGLATDVRPYVRDLVEAFWPGPLTVIVHAQPSLQWDLGETKGTVALRMPDDEAALDLLREVGPMAVTSANRTGGPPAHSVLEAATALGAAVEVYLDGGPRADLAPSTILDCTGAEPAVLRLGSLDADRINTVAKLHSHHDVPEPEPEPDDPEIE